jgi:hypothetical protein
MLGLGYEEVRGAAWDTAVLSRLQNVFPAFLKKTNCKKKKTFCKNAKMLAKSKTLANIARSARGPVG